MIKETFADSTVAMSTYNILCKMGMTKDPLDLLPSIQESALRGLKKKRLQSVVKLMIKKGMIVKRSDGFYPADPQRKMMVIRDRDDAYVDNRGKIQGGWEGWKTVGQLGELIPAKFFPPKEKVKK